MMQSSENSGMDGQTDGRQWFHRTDAVRLTSSVQNDKYELSEICCGIFNFSKSEIIISLFNADAKNKVKNYNKKEIIVYIINYNI